MNISDYEVVLPYIDALNISIDGYDDKTSFIRDKGIMKRVLDTVERLKEKIPIKLIVTLHKKNVPFMQIMLKRNASSATAELLFHF